MCATEKNLFELTQKAESMAAPFYKRVEQIAQANTEKVLKAFNRHRVSDTYFAGTTGYGYDDKGRDSLENIYADCFGAEAALVRLTFVNGTHAIACAMFASLKAGDTLLSATGPVYDTLMTVVGKGQDKRGSFADYGIHYEEVPLGADGLLDLDAIEAALKRNRSIRAVFIQRSRGYQDRKALSCKDIAQAIKRIKGVCPSLYVIVDNCYGEFVETMEPCDVGADLIAGSLIKNPGGGLAPCGGYIAGRKELVEAAAFRMTLPGIGGECGPSLGHNRLLYQGFFLAPHVVAQALKTAIFCAKVMELLGYDVSPLASEARYDIIQTIKFGKKEPLLAFCRGIQKGAPVDSYVTPEPWDMPGYDCPVVMAAGAFIQGASIELSCDAPMREPFIAYMQGGLTYESGKLGVLLGAKELL